MTLNRTRTSGYPTCLGAKALSGFLLPRHAPPLQPPPQPTSRHAAPPGLEWSRNQLRCGGRQTAASPKLPDVPGARTAKMARVEAALLVADRPLSLKKLVQHATLVDPDDALAQIERLNAGFEQDDSPFRIERVATGFQLLTRPEFAAWLDKRHHRPARMKLSQPAMETLTVVAYRQPVTRADVEAVRGVQSGEILKQLMDRGLVRITGEDDTLGRPYLYGTTRLFLEQFGLHNLDELPDSAELSRPATVDAVSDQEPEATPGNAEHEPHAEDASDAAAA